MKKQTGWRKFKASIPNLIGLIPSRSHLELLSMYDKCTEIMAGRRPAEISPAIQSLHDAIVLEWKTRCDDLLLGRALFDWPSTEAPPGDGNLSSQLWHSVGMFSALGYHVGRTNGRSEQVRHFLLDEMFARALPPMNGPSYMRKWGSPATADRLQQMAETLAALTRNAKRHRSQNMQDACAEWESDLRYLYENYYVPMTKLPRFAWPIVER